MKDERDETQIDRLHRLFLSKRDCLSALERAILFDSYSSTEGHPIIVNITSNSSETKNQMIGQTLDSKEHHLLQRLGFYPKDNFREFIGKRRSFGSDNNGDDEIMSRQQTIGDLLPSRDEEAEESETLQKTTENNNETLLDEFEFLSLEEKKSLVKKVAELPLSTEISSSLFMVARLQAIAEREIYVELLPAILRLLLFIDGSVPTLAWLRYRINHIVNSNVDYLVEYDNEGHSQSSILNNLLLLLIVWCRSVDSQDWRDGDFDDVTIDSIISLSIAASGADYSVDLCNVGLRALVR